MKMDLSGVADASVVLPNATAGAPPINSTASGNQPPAQTQPAAPAAPRPATLAELEETCKGAPSDFLLAQLKAQATIAQASTAWMSKLQQQNEQLAKENKELADKHSAAQTTAATAKPGAPRVAPSETGGKSSSSTSTAAGDDAISQFEEAVQSEMDRKKCERHVAHATICRTRPDLREAMLAAHNAEHGHKLRGRR